MKKDKSNIKVDGTIVNLTDMVNYKPILIFTKDILKMVSSKAKVSSILILHKNTTTIHKTKTIITQNI